MLSIKDNKVLIPLGFWNELKSDIYFAEFISALEDRLELIEAKEEADEFFDFDNYVYPEIKD